MSKRISFDENSNSVWVDGKPEVYQPVPVHGHIAKMRCEECGIGNLLGGPCKVGSEMGEICQRVMYHCDSLVTWRNMQTLPLVNNLVARALHGIEQYAAELSPEEVPAFCFLLRDGIERMETTGHAFPEELLPF